MTKPAERPTLHEVGPGPVRDGADRWIAPAEQRCLRCGAVVWSYDPETCYFPAVPDPWPAGPVTTDGLITIGGDHEGAEECRA